jgi:tetratricopeptide (TPR) repeat protein
MMGVASSLEERVVPYCHIAIEGFKKVTRYYSLFHFGFLTLALFEILFFFFSLSFSMKSSMLALSLALIFFTGFAYFVLLFYFQAKKPEELMHLKNSYMEACEGEALPVLGTTDYHYFLSRSAYRLVAQLRDQEYTYYPLPKRLKALFSLFEKLSGWAHWREVHQMKENLIFHAIDHHLQLVKTLPLDIEVHASLAQAYITLSKLYLDPKKGSSLKEGQWVSPKYHSHEMQQKFKAAAERAIQELTIVDHLAPDHPWVYAELAAIYHDLERSTEELTAYENLFRLSSDDQEVLFRLGVLYFKRGLCAQGLSMYEELRKRTGQQERAEELISYYDIYLRQT